MPSIQKQMSSWMFDTALPWWAEHSWDHAHGGCIEAFTFEGEDAALAFKRTRVACRQIYVFSHAHMLGWSGGLDLAQQLVDHLTTNVWQNDKTGFARRMTREGKVLDPTTDLYDHAFALFAFAWHYRATKDTRSRDWIYKTIDFIETRLRHPSGLGYLHQNPAEGWRLQNPHMHLTEACLAAYAATKDQRFATIATDIVALFRSHFFDAQTGTLGEFFTEDLKRAPGDPGQIAEPGHQYEWAWILNEARKDLGITGLEDTILALIKFGETHGLTPSSLAVYNSVTTDGTPLDASSRSWPNTERVKAAIALYELTGKDPSPTIKQSGGLLLDRYLADAPPGLWVDDYDVDGNATAPDVPTSILYHVFLAFAEVLRIAPALREPDET